MRMPRWQLDSPRLLASIVLVSCSIRSRAFVPFASALRQPLVGPPRVHASRPQRVQAASPVATPALGIASLRSFCLSAPLRWSHTAPRGMTGALAEGGADGVGGGEEAPAPKKRKSKKRRVDELLVEQVTAPPPVRVAIADPGACVRADARAGPCRATARLTSRGRAGAGGRRQAGSGVNARGEGGVRQRAHRLPGAQGPPTPNLQLYPSETELGGAERRLVPEVI